MNTDVLTAKEVEGIAAAVYTLTRNRWDREQWRSCRPATRRAYLRLITAALAHAGIGYDDPLTIDTIDAG